AGVVTVGGDEVDGVGLAAAGHRYVGAGSGGVFAEGEMRSGGGGSLRAVCGGGVGEFDVLAHVLGGECAASPVGAGEGERAVAAYAGDGPGITIGDVEGVVVAPGRDQVAGTDRLPVPAAGRVLVVDETGCDEPLADRAVERRGLFAGIDHDRDRAP